MMLGSTIDPLARRRIRPQSSVVLPDDVFYTPRLMRLTNLSPDMSVNGVTLSTDKLTATNTSSGSTGQGVAIPRIDGLLFPNFDGFTFIEVKHYVEFQLVNLTGGNNVGVGFAIGSTSFMPDRADTSNARGAMLYVSDGQIWVSTGGGNYGYSSLHLGALAEGDVIGMAVNFQDTFGKGIYFKKVNGSPSGWNDPDPDQLAADPLVQGTGVQMVTAADAHGPIPTVPWITFGGSGANSGNEIRINVGQEPFVGQVPTGYEGYWQASQNIVPDLLVDEDLIQGASGVYQI